MAQLLKIKFFSFCLIIFSITNAFGMPTIKEEFVSMPEPAAMVLLGTGLILIAGVGKMRYKK